MQPRRSARLRHDDEAQEGGQGTERHNLSTNSRGHQHHGPTTTDLHGFDGLNEDFGYALYGQQYPFGGYDNQMVHEDVDFHLGEQTYTQHPPAQQYNALHTAQPGATNTDLFSPIRTREHTGTPSRPHAIYDSGYEGNASTSPPPFGRTAGYDHANSYYTEMDGTALNGTGDWQSTTGPNLDPSGLQRHGHHPLGQIGPDAIANRTRRRRTAGSQAQAQPRPPPQPLSQVPEPHTSAPSTGYTCTHHGCTRHFDTGAEMR